MYEPLSLTQTVFAASFSSRELEGREDRHRPSQEADEGAHYRLRIERGAYLHPVTSLLLFLWYHLVPGSREMRMAMLLSFLAVTGRGASWPHFQWTCQVLLWGQWAAGSSHFGWPHGWTGPDLLQAELCCHPHIAYRRLRLRELAQLAEGCLVDPPPPPVVFSLLLMQQLFILGPLCSLENFE